MADAVCQQVSIREHEETRQVSLLCSASAQSSTAHSNPCRKRNYKSDPGSNVFRYAQYARSMYSSPTFTTGLSWSMSTPRPSSFSSFHTDANANGIEHNAWQDAASPHSLQPPPALFSNPRRGLTNGTDRFASLTLHS